MYKLLYKSFHLIEDSLVNPRDVSNLHQAGKLPPHLPVVVDELGSFVTYGGESGYLLNTSPVQEDNHGLILVVLHGFSGPFA